MVSCWFVEVHCTRPQNLTAKAVWKRTMSLSWKPAPFMGRFTNILCYRIWYAAAHDKKNEVNFYSFFFFFCSAKMKSILNFCDDFYLLPQRISVHLLHIFFIPLPPPSGNTGCSSQLLWPYDLLFFLTSLPPPPPWSLVTTSLKLLSTFCWILVGTDNLRGWITDHWWPFSVHRIQVLYPV